MSRTFADNAGLTTLENAVVKPFWTTLTMQDDVLHFQLNTSYGNNGTQDSAVCQSNFQSTVANGKIAGMDNGGVLYITETTYTGASLGIASSNSSRVRVTSTSGYIPCMHGSFAPNGEFWWTEHDVFGSGIQLWKGSLSGTTFTRTLVANSSFFTALGAMANGSDMIRRIDSVCYTENGIVIAAGNYDFGRKQATIQFYLYNSSFYPTGCKQLETIIQYKFDETYTNWYSANKLGSFTHASCDPNSTNRLVVVGNDGRRAMKFNIRYGAESALEPVIPIDYDLGGDLPQHKFIPTGIMKTAGVLLMSGQYKRPFTDNTSVIVEMYSTSKDGVNWSVGEYSSFITSNATYQVLPVLSSSYTAPGNITSVGSMVSYYATGRVIDGNGAATSIMDNVLEGALECATSSADSLTLALHTNPAGLKAGYRLDLSMGLLNSSAVQKGGAMGRYITMNTPLNNTPYGKVAGDVSALDEASWRLSSWNSPVDVDRWSNTQIPDQWSTSPSMETTLVTKTPIRGITFAASGIASTALNDPYVGFTTTRDERDGQVSIKARFTSTDTYSSQAVGLIFGGTETDFNAFIVPRPNSWLNTTNTPFVAKSNLNAGNWEIDQQQTGIWKSILSDPFSRIMQHPNASASGTDSYWYNGSLASAFVVANEDYKFTLRTQGRRAQLFAKKVRPLYSEMATYADNTPLVEYRFAAHTQKKFDDRQYFGAIAGTDVPGSKDWWRQAQYGDIAQSMTFVSPLWTEAKTDYYTRSIGTATATHDGAGNLALTSVDLTHACVDNFPGGTLPVGWLILITGASTGANFLVATRASGAKNANFTATLFNGFSAHSTTDTVTFWIIGPADRFGYASSASQYKFVEPAVGEEYMVISDPGAIKRNEQSYGRAIFISEDNTALSTRYIRTDGVITDILSAGGTGATWDWPTNPIGKDADDVPYLGRGDSEPGEWRVFMNHGMFFEGQPSLYGLPNSSYNAFRVEDEIVRGRMESFYLPGYSTRFDGCFIPTFYRPLQNVARGSFTLGGWKHSGGAMPGDNFNDVLTSMGATDFKGMLVEVVSRNVATEPIEEAIQYYASTASTVSGIDYVTLDKAYQAQVENLEAVAVLSGRGWGDTTKVLHPADSPAVYCPLEAADIAACKAPVDYLRLSDFKGMIGTFNSAEDDIKYVANMAGVRDVTFGSKYNATTTPSTSGTTISASIANFVLELNAHTYSDGTSIKIGIRSNYILHIRANNGLTGTVGVLELMLEMPTSAITASGGNKWLEKVQVPISDYFPFGNLNSGGARTEDTSVKNNYRIIVNNNMIHVEMEGMHVWTFDLKEFDYINVSGQTVSQYVLAPGALTVQYSASSALSVTARTQELSEEIENHIVDIAGSGDEAIGFVTGERHILMRSNQTGGLEFSRYLTRASTETIVENIVTTNENEANLDPVGHMQVSGAEYGEYVDESWIQANGYRFGSGSNRLLNTVSDSIQEATLLQRLSKENSKQYALAISGVKYKWQPEDGIVWNSIPMVISSAAIGFSKDYRNSSYQLRLNYG